MLLHELYETKVCSPLLFPKSDEDIWRHDDPMSVSPQGVPIMKSDSKGRAWGYVAPLPSYPSHLTSPHHFRNNVFIIQKVFHYICIWQDSGETNSDRECQYRDRTNAWLTALLRYYHVVVLGSLSRVSVQIDEYKIHVCVWREICCLIQLVTILSYLYENAIVCNSWNPLIL